MRATRDAPPVVFVPGFMQHGDAWAPVTERLPARYRSVLLDPVGESFEARVGEILATTAPRPAVVGYSMGGRLALHAAVREPERFAALVLVGAGAGLEDPAERAERRAADARLADWMERSPIEAVVARWEALPVFATQDEALRARQRPGRLRHDPAALARLLRSTGQGTLAPLWSALGTLALPVLAVAGEHDPRYVAVAERLARELPAGGAHVVARAGHAPQLERPDAVARALEEFLDEHLVEG